jgi:hypothetical protein
MAKDITDPGAFYGINNVEQTWVQVLYGGVATFFFQVMSTDTSEQTVFDEFLDECFPCRQTGWGDVKSGQNCEPQN